MVAEAARSPLAIAAVVSFAISVLMLAVPIFSLQVFDRVLGSGSRDTLVALVLITGLALTALGLLETVRTSVLARLSTRLGARLSPQLLAAGAQAGDPGQGLRDLTQLRQTLSGPALTAIFDAPWLPIALTLVWLLHPILGYFGLASALVLAVLAVLGDLVARRRLKDANALTPRAQRQVDALGRQREVVTAMGILPNLQARFARLHDQVLVLQQRAYERGGMVSGVARSARLMIQAGVMALGALLVLQSELTAGGMIAASILLSRALAPIEQMLAGWRSLVQASECWQRLRVLLAHAPAGAEALALPPPTGAVTLERVTFEVDGRSVLNPCSLSLEPGEFLGIVGPSGAGKSTLCRLMVGVLSPSSGIVRLDGVDIATQSRAVLGPYVGYLPQHTGLFAGTVAENIARMAPEPDPERVVAAAQAAEVHELILRLPKGYDTQLGDDGAPLSAGQRQRLGLARAIYGEPKLVILDEPNAHLDGSGEQALANALALLKRHGATVVLVTHRLNILRHADRVLVMENGGIKQVGARDQILGELLRPARVA
jgi:ATP-binding cassette subfamily C protein/ATP-binding cassette subfamily C exporter for protease/lipase/ATP-binding cassette subfamily C protein EexD